MTRAVVAAGDFRPKPAETGACPPTNSVVRPTRLGPSHSVGVQQRPALVYAPLGRKAARESGSGTRSPFSLVLDLGRLLVTLGAGCTCARGAAARGSGAAAPPPPGRPHWSWRFADAAHRADGPTPLVVVEPSPAPAVRAPQLGGRDPPCSTSGAWVRGAAHTGTVHHRCTSVLAARAQSGPPARSHRGAEGLGVVDSAAVLAHGRCPPQVYAQGHGSHRFSGEAPHSGGVVGRCGIGAAALGRSGEAGPPWWRSEARPPAPARPGRG